MSEELSIVVEQALKKNATKAQMTAFKGLVEKERQFNEKNKELEDVKVTLKEKSSKLAELQATLEAQRLDSVMQLEAFNKQYTRYHQLEEELNQMKKKMVTSYSAEDISTYLNQVIKEFNSSTVADNNVATYIINNMDVDLKVRIYGDEKDSIRFTAPNITETTEDSLSSIKISIQAVPK